MSWVQSPITGLLTQVPGIDEQNLMKLHENDVTSTFQLLGTFLSFKGIGVSQR